MDGFDPTAWRDFGLAGMVIGSLFALVVYLQRQYTTSTERTISRVTDAHRQERTQWYEQAERRENRTALAMERLADEMRTSRQWPSRSRDAGGTGTPERT